MFHQLGAGRVARLGGSAYLSAAQPRTRALRGQTGAAFATDTARLWFDCDALEIAQPAVARGHIESRHEPAPVHFDTDKMPSPFMMS
jgi:hypothetical protein